MRWKIDRNGHSKLKGEPELLKKNKKVKNAEVEVVSDQGQSETIKFYFSGKDEKNIGRVEEIKAELLYESLNVLPLYVCFKLIQKVGKGDIRYTTKRRLHWN